MMISVFALVNIFWRLMHCFPNVYYLIINYMKLIKTV